ncbi:MAG TPA: heme ABC transporter permease [Aliidongia sp.]|nr:heme ABC transporter permease [Aliidongia sp.]
MHRFANPARFMRVSAPIVPWLAAMTAAFLLVGLVLGFRAPPDYQQGDTVRIMFIHVPAAWMAMATYSVVAAASAAALIWRHPLAEIAAQEAAPLGAAFTAVCLVSGSLWGAPTWGTWWVWDARLTSVLVLFFLYLGYIALSHAFDDPTRGSRAASVLALVGWINIPIIKFSVDWWNSLHQPASVLRLGGSTIDASILVPLLIMAVAFTLLFVLLLLLRMRAALLERKIRALQMVEAEATASSYALAGR